MKTDLHRSNKLLYADLTYKVRGAIFAVYNGLGFGHKEQVYQKALASELEERSIPYKRERSLNVKYKDEIVGSYRPDFVVDEKVVVEIKAVEFMPKTFETQLINYLKTTGFNLGLLVNFGSSRLFIKRLVWSNPRKSANNPRKSLKRVVAILLILALQLNTAAGYAFAQIATEGMDSTSSPSAGSASEDTSNILNGPKVTPQTSSNPIELNVADVYKSSATLRGETVIGLLEKNTFRKNENISLVVQNANITNIGVKLFYSDQREVDAQIQEIKHENNTEIRIFPPPQFKPGYYQLEITANGKYLKQEFAWGILAINMNKPVYNPLENAKFTIIALDDYGEMICDADLTLKIVDPFSKETNLSSENRGIKTNYGCNKNKLTDTPYEASYAVGQAGVYKVYLSAINGNQTYSIEDSFEVKNETPFDIERAFPSAVSPNSSYEASIKIKANEDFNGTVKELVPAGFDISKLEGVREYKEVYLSEQKSAEKEKVLGVSSNFSPPFKGDYPVTEAYGDPVKDPLLKKFYFQFGVAGHDGIDFGLPKGTPVLSVDDGVVVLEDTSGAYGTTLVVQHSWGKSYYGHLSSFVAKDNQNVSKGEVIALSGSTGLVTGPHLHFGIKLDNNDPTNGYYGKIDPAPYLGLDGENRVLSASDYQKPLKIIVWDLSLKKGETESIGYQFKTENNNSQFYNVGSLLFFEPGKTGSSYEEQRTWSVVSQTSGNVLGATSDLGRKVKGFKFDTLKTEFKAKEKPTFAVNLETDKADKVDLTKVIKNTVTGENPDIGGIQIKAENSVDKKQLPIEVKATSVDEVQVQVADLASFRPGKYTLVVTNGQRSIEQDFTWGVLAINTNKSIYNPGDTVKLGMALLDDLGRTKCLIADDPLAQGKLWLTVTDPEGKVSNFSTDEGTIKGNPDCFDRSVTNIPDFYMEYKTISEGVYQMFLTGENQNGKRSISDYFQVKKDEPFEVERIAPTRIFPLSDYEITIKIHANKDYSGKVIEKTPASFVVTCDDCKVTGENTQINPSADERTHEIIWNADFQKGQDYTLSYKVNPPDISPEFYLLGPLKIGDFQEARQWQIASDPATGDFRSHQTGDWNVTSTWERWDGASWITPAPSTPVSTDGVIEIQSGHTVTVTANVTVDQVLVDSGGEIDVNNGVTWTLAAGTGDDLTINSTGNGGGAGVVLNGTIPAAILQITINAGSMTVSSTGSFSTTSNVNSAFTINSGGTLTINSGATFSHAAPFTANTGSIVTIDSAITIGRTASATTFNGTVDASANITLASISNLQIGGTVTMTAGTLQPTRGNGGPLGSINSGGSLILQNSSNFAIAGSGNATYTVASGGTLEIDPSALVNGVGSLVVASGANLKIGSVDGIDSKTGSGSTGNVQTTSTTADSYSTGANYTYDGTANQNTGTGLPSTVNNLTISNTSGIVTIGNAAVLTETISGTMQVDANAIASPSAATIINGSGGTLTGSGTVKMSRAKGTAGTIDFNSQYTINTKTLTNLTVDYVSTSSATVVNALAYNHLKVEPEANSVTHTFQTGTTTVSGNFTSGDGTHTSIIVDANANTPTLTITGNFTNNANTEFKANSSNALTVGGSWSNAGTFTANSGNVTLNSGTTATVNGGPTTFYDLTITHTAAKEVDFSITASHIIHVTHTFTVTGNAGALIKLFSTSAGTKWHFHPTGTASVDYANVKDGGCESGSITITPTNSTDGLNNDSCWNFPATGPTLDQLLKHGAWFNSSGVEQPFTF